MNINEEIAGLEKDRRDLMDTIVVLLERIEKLETELRHTASQIEEITQEAR